MFSLAPAIDVRDTLQAAGIPADLDPALVDLPGVWIQVTDLDVDTLASVRNTMQLALVTGDTDATQAATGLVELLNQVAAVLPVRRASARTVLMPDGTRLPGLVVPFADRAPIESE